MSKFPIGGPREPVYAFLRDHGYVMSAGNDKEWTRADGITLNLYGAGSRAVIRRGDDVIADADLADAVAKARL